MHTITKRSVNRKQMMKKRSKLLRNDGRPNKPYIAVAYKEYKQNGLDRIKLLHPTKGWRDYNLDNPIMGVHVG